MAVFIQDITICPICGAVVQSHEEAVSYPAMVWNELDPLAAISDATIHYSCLLSIGLIENAEKRKTSVSMLSDPERRKCELCCNKIDSPVDYLTVGYLTDDSEALLFKYNLSQYHKSCLSQWGGLSNLIELLQEYNTPSQWKGPWLDFLIRELNSLVPMPN